MDDHHAPLGLVIAALGAAVLAVSVFLPWYGVSLTPSGAASAQREFTALVQQYGNATVQAEANRAGAQFDSLVGRQIVTVSARRGMKYVSLILLALAGIALLTTLLRLADMRGLLFATGGQIALFGFLAALVVFFRMLWRPGASEFILFSLSPGIWLALVSALAVAGGGLLAGSAQVHPRSGRKVGPGPPPLGQDVVSARVIARKS